MIGYSLIDDDDPIEVKKPIRQADISPEREIVQKEKIVPVRAIENTECNYVVMFFIAGVITLAIMDALPKK